MKKLLIIFILIFSFVHVNISRCKLKWYLCIKGNISNSFMIIYVSRTIFHLEKNDVIFKK